MKLELNHISKAYGRTKALTDFSATLEPGIYALLGPNGSGKSTLMNIITDNLKANKGEIVFDGPSSMITKELLDEIYGGSTVPTSKDEQKAKEA